MSDKLKTGMAVLVTMMVATAAFAQAGAASLVAAESQQPGKLVAENIDRSDVSKATQNGVERAVQEWQAAEAKQDAAGKAKAKATLIDLFKVDQKNVALLTWLGFIHYRDAEMAPAIAVLELVARKSSDPEVNIANQRNLSLAYYAGADYPKAAASLEELNRLEPGKAATLALLGSTYLIQNQYEQAIPPLREARALVPAEDAGRAKLDTDLATAYIKTGKTDEAIAVFEEMDANGTASDIALSWLGFAYLQKNEDGKALAVLERAQKINPRNPQVLNNLANIYAKQGTPEGRQRAIGLYVELTKLQPTLATPWYNAGSLYLQEQDYRKAKEFLSKSITITRDPFALNNLGRAHEGLKEIQEAATYYAEASDLRPENALFAHNAGLALIKLREDRRALSYLQRAIANGDPDPTLPKIIAEIQVRTGQDADALASLEALKDKYKDDPSFWFNLGVLRQKKGDTKGAEEAYRKCLDLKPDDIDALNNLGLILYRKGDYEGAVTLFEKLSGMNKSSTDAKINLAASLARAGRAGLAIEIWKEIVRAEPERIETRLDLADALYGAGDVDGARFHYATALKQKPDNVRALNGLGLWHLLQSSNVEAEKLFRRAITADPKYMPPYNNLAITLERLNRKKEAIQILEEALRIKPDFEDARTNLARLKSSDS